MENNPKEKCVVCNKDTTFDFDTHIDMRISYIEGVGQFCTACYKNDSINKSNSQSIIPDSIIIRSLSDEKLSEKVMRLYSNKKDK